MHGHRAIKGQQFDPARQCPQCWVDERREVPGIYMIDGEALCLPHAKAAVGEENLADFIRLAPELAPPTH
jgi:hypothetical protein